MAIDGKGPLGFMRPEDCKYFEAKWKLRRLEEEMERRRQEEKELRRRMREMRESEDKNKDGDGETPED